MVQRRQNLVITYAYLRIEESGLLGKCDGKDVITYAYLRIEELKSHYRGRVLQVITYAYLRIEEATGRTRQQRTQRYNLRISIYIFILR